MAKRKTHRLSYYLSALKDPGLTCGQLDELLTDAAFETIMMSPST